MINSVLVILQPTVRRRPGAEGLIRRARSEGPAVRLRSSPPLFGGALEPMQSLKRTACPCDGTATNNKRCVVNMAKKLRRLEPREGAWRVEYFDGDGAGYVAVFAGQSAEVRARDYYDAIKRGALKTRIADAEVVTAKKVVSFPQKRRRPVR